MLGRDVENDHMSVMEILNNIRLFMKTLSDNNVPAATLSKLMTGVYGILKHGTNVDIWIGQSLYMELDVEGGFEADVRMDVDGSHSYRVRNMNTEPP